MVWMTFTYKLKYLYSTCILWLGKHVGLVDLITRKEEYIYDVFALDSIIFIWHWLNFQTF